MLEVPQSPAHIYLSAVSKVLWKGPAINNKCQGTTPINASGCFMRTFCFYSISALKNLIPSFLKTREGCWKSRICCCKIQLFRSSLYIQRTFHAGGISDSHLNTYILIPANELSNSHKTEHLIGVVHAGGILAKALTFSNSTWVSFLGQTQHLSQLSNLLAILRG